MSLHHYDNYIWPLAWRCGAEWKAVADADSDREKYVAAQRKSQSATNTLDMVVIGTVREQAQKRQFKFE